MNKKKAFRQKLWLWYDQNKRELPWRGLKDPYTIWVSEIIFQQTRIDQGMNYFLKFIERFPDVSSLAEADENEVILIWQGLGYYSRARNMHYTANFIMKEYRGVFPDDYKEILSLKGIGPYTASMIASVCYNQVQPAIDGNVIRLVSRLYALDVGYDKAASKRKYQEILQELIDPERPGDFNEAMMDLGSMICTPRKPACGECPLSSFCLAEKSGHQDKYPPAVPKKKIRKRYFHYFIIQKEKGVYLQKRTTKDIWKNMYEFPLKEVQKDLSRKTIPAGEFGFSNEKISQSIELKHKLSHQELLIYFHFLEGELKSDEFLWVKKKSLENYPFPKPFQEIIKTLQEEH